MRNDKKDHDGLKEWARPDGCEWRVATELREGVLSRSMADKVNVFIGMYPRRAGQIFHGLAEILRKRDEAGFGVHTDFHQNPPSFPHGRDILKARRARVIHGARRAHASGVCRHGRRRGDGAKSVRSGFPQAASAFGQRLSYR